MWSTAIKSVLDREKNAVKTLYTQSQARIEEAVNISPDSQEALILPREMNAIEREFVEEVIKSAVKIEEEVRTVLTDLPITDHAVSSAADDRKKNAFYLQVVNK
ncbi:MAG TPA: hypothetical protein VHZ76_09345, partial [Gammaproteobacteria bacterium]|nr:hypothetical protein [Gammaproteobacteria bacterium]